uniref:Uncharacterized protein n=1 Tax=Peronospora matthiolae TaxID=2874970 RepID=A0AAV1UPU5_9STRA
MDTSSRPRKRLTSALHQRAAASEPSRTSAFVHGFATAPSAMDIRAFGLEDRAEAVIARDRDTWTLANLSKWRHGTLDQTDNNTWHTQWKAQTDTNLSTKAYVRQRQRAYRHQCLLSSKIKPTEAQPT